MDYARSLADQIKKLKFYLQVCQKFYLLPPGSPHYTSRTNLLQHSLHLLIAPSPSCALRHRSIIMKIYWSYATSPWLRNCHRNRGQRLQGLTDVRGNSIVLESLGARFVACSAAFPRLLHLSLLLPSLPQLLNPIILLHPPPQP